MSSIATRYQLLTRTIESKNDEKISEAILDLASRGEFSAELIDTYNLPFLITNCAPRNSECQMLLSAHHQAKARILQEEKPKILMEFENGLRNQMDGFVAPQVTAKFLAMMTQSMDLDFARLGFKLLVELEFEDEDLEVLHHYATQYRARCPEAELLVQKIERIQRDNEVNDMEMEDDSEEEEEDDVDFEFEEDDESFLSTGSNDSGFEEEPEEILIEEEEALMEEEANFDYALMEIFMQVLRESLCTGISDKIQAAIDLLEELQLPIPVNVYRRHEIARFIVQYAAHNDDAIELLLEIEQQ